MKNIEQRVCEMRNIILNEDFKSLTQIKNKPIDERIGGVSNEEMDDGTCCCSIGHIALFHVIL